MKVALFHFLFIITLHGKVAEWLKAPLSKSDRGESSSGVRISPFPQ